MENSDAAGATGYAALLASILETAKRAAEIGGLEAGEVLAEAFTALEEQRTGAPQDPPKTRRARKEVRA